MVTHLLKGNQRVKVTKWTLDTIGRNRARFDIAATGPNGPVTYHLRITGRYVRDKFVPASYELGPGHLYEPTSISQEAAVWMGGLAVRSMPGGGLILFGPSGDAENEALREMDDW